MDEQNIPIDINTSKLMDWLISRRHVNKDCQGDVVKVREKINAAIQDMPEHKEIVNLLSGQHINYFHCLKIVEILKETEADTKNIFGRYGSQRMKDWQDVVSSYQKDNIYLAETAQILIRNVNYEVPSLRKRLVKIEQTILECDKKIKDCLKTETNALKEYKALCDELSLEGKNIKKELVKLIDELPKIFKVSADKIKVVKPVIDFYSSFVKFQSGKELEVVPLLKFLIEKGNTTTYEYVYGEKPLRIEDPPLLVDLNIDDDSSDNQEIDFGENINFGDNIAYGADVDFGNNEVDFSDQIDFGDIEVSKGTESGSSNNTEGFEIVSHDELENLEESGIVVEESGHDGGVACGDEALTILDNPKTREQILNNLLELEAFLKMRLYEMSSEGNFVTMIVMQNAPMSLQNITMENVTEYADFINIALNELTNKRVQYLHNIKHSPKYVDILTTSLKQKLIVVDRMKTTKTLHEDKIEALQNEASELKPVIDNIIAKSKELQKNLENEISKRYKGRIVNIVGGINML